MPSTPAQLPNASQSPHYVIAERAVPGWLANGAPDTLRILRSKGVPSLPWLDDARQTEPQAVTALQKAWAGHYHDTTQVNAVLAQLPAVEDFAEPLLKAAIEARFGAVVDVTATYLFNASRVLINDSFMTASQDPLVAMHRAMKAATSSLLQAALQNFEAREAIPGGMDNGATLAGIFSAHPVMGTSLVGTPLPIAPDEFASLCRELDLGQQYQSAIQAAMTPSDLPGDSPGSAAINISTRFKLFEQSALTVQARIACLKKDIDPATQALVLDIAGNRQSERCAFLTLFGIETSAIVILADKPAPQTFIVYLPDDPVAPVKGYASMEAFADDLRQKMTSPGYTRFFARFVPARVRNQFFSLLHKTLYPLTWNSFYRAYEERFDANANLHLATVPLPTFFLTAVHDKHLATLKDDALFHAVPTAVENQKTHDEKIQYFVSAFFEAANIAAFVVPGLGEVMLAVTALELCHTVYEGFASLAHGDRDAAFDYLMDVIDNVAMMALMAAAGGAASHGTPGVAAPEAVQGMKPVSLPDGTQRLWQPDLAPFHHDIVLPADLKPNELGLYDYQGKQWLPLDGRLHAVKPPAGDAPYRLEHPTRANSYEPPLRHNGKGAWLHELDQPGEWEGPTLFKRLGQRAAAFSDAQATQIMRVSGTHEAVLRRSLAEAQRPPALLEDTLARFQLDQDLDTFIIQLETGNAADPELQLQLLSEEPGWPANRVLTLLDSDGQAVRQFGPLRGDQAAAPVIVRPGDDVLPSILEQLTVRENRDLFGEEFGSSNLGTARRAQMLRKQLADSARVRRNELFALRYDQLQHNDSPFVQRLRQTFKGLPTSIAEELEANATQAELTLLRTEGKLPERIAGEARVYQQKLRLARAYEGLFLDSVQTLDSEKVKLHSVEALPGWSNEVNVQVHDGRFGGPQLDSVGPDQAPVRKVLVKQDDLYQARDEDDGHLHGNDNLYGALLHALPDGPRAQLGFPHVGQKTDLQYTVRQAPLLPRRKVQELLQTQPTKPGEKSPMRLAEGRPGDPVTTTERIITDDSLLDKLRILDLDAALDSDAEALLTKLEQAGLTRTGIDTRLNQLLSEQQALQSSLDQWALDSASQPPLPPARQLSRQRIAEALWRHWRANALPELGAGHTPLQLDGVILQDFPQTLPDFISERTQALRLSDFSPHAENLSPQMPVSAVLAEISTNTDTLTAFFRRFPRVTRLSLRGTRHHLYSSRQPWTQLVREHFPGLTELELMDMSLFIDANDMADLRALTELRRLDLSNNFLHAQPNFAGLTLDYLGLDRTVLGNAGTLHQTALDPALLDHVRELSLRGNRITDLPPALLANPQSTGPVTRLILNNNPLPRSTLMEACMSEGPGSRYQFSVDLPPSTLQTLASQRDELARILADWTEAGTSSTLQNDAQLIARREFAQRLTAFWRASRLNESAPLLELTGVDATNFPASLPAFFTERVDRLRLVKPVASEAQLNQLLRRFPNLESLTMDGHVTPLQRLPAAVGELQYMQFLELHNLGLTIDQPLLDNLARNAVLRALSLDGNTLGIINDATVLRRTDLNSLSLENFGLSDWPDWLDSLLPRPLASLSLENNQLSAVPDYLLTNARSSDHVTHINLRNNPLPEDVMRSLQVSESYSSSYTFDTDLLEDVNSANSDGESDGSSGSSSSGHSPHGPATATAAATAEPWLTHGDVEVEPARRHTWEQLREHGDADNLLGLVDHLRASADYRSSKNRAALTERVWSVLDAAAQDTELRQLLDATAEEPLQLVQANDTCPDGVRLAFNQIEVQVFTRQALQDASGAQRGERFNRLMRQMYRLDELDRIAIENTGLRDEAEVRLVYRLRLAPALDLPQPPAAMLYASAADLSPMELENALAQVQLGERGDALLSYAVRQDFWQSYLRETYPERFQALRDEYQTRVLALTDAYPEETQDQIGERIMLLDQQLRDDEEMLMKELTNQQSQLYS